jgi:NAD(P)-dependent dehydrogenase (short-subunit alcohol dehydrogenase family)
MLTFAGKLGLVTGGGTGFGEAIAAELAAQGASIVLHCAFDQRVAQKTVEGILAGGGRATIVQGDLSVVEECRRVVDGAVEFLGGLDILVNSASAHEPCDFFAVTPQQFDQIIQQNVRAQYFCAQSAAPHLAQRSGSILNVASMHAFAGAPGYTLHSAEAGAIVAMTRELAAELLSQHVRVNAIAPGILETCEDLTCGDPVRPYGSQVSPWGRAGSLAEIARTATFLVSDAAGFVTGQVLYVDGGTTAKIAATPVPWGK